MRDLRQQRGLTTMSMVFILTLIVFFAIIAIRLFPIYVEHFKVKNHLERVAGEVAAGGLSDSAVINTLLRRFDIDDVDNVTEENIFIEHPERDRTVIAIEYEVRTPAFANVDMVVSFADEVEVGP